MGARWIAKWSGGRIRIADGQRVWVIERTIAGQRYAITLDAATPDEATAELVAFERDPVAYIAAREQPATASADPLIVDADLIGRFAAFALADNRNELYVRDVLTKYLGEWAGVLKGRDLRKVATVELRQKLSMWKTAKKHRVIALKSLSAWLRDEAALLTVQADPTLGLMSVPAPRRRAEADAKAFTIAEVEEVYRVVEAQAVRDLIVAGAKTGLHGTELDRFAKGRGVLRAVGPWKGCSIVGTVRVNHKSGDPHTVSVDAQAFAALTRLRETGGRSRSAAYAHLADVAHRFGVPHLLLGSLRHSFVTWCRTPGLGVKKVEPPQAAVSLEDVAAVTGHRTTATTRRFYDEAVAVPFMLAIPIRLSHPDDPRPLAVGVRRKRE